MTHGPPPYGQTPYGQTPYGQTPYGAPPYGQTPYGPPAYAPYAYPPPWGVPRGPRRPGQVTAAAVLSFVQAGVVLFATLYLWLMVSIGRLAQSSTHGLGSGGPLVAEGSWLAVVQGFSVVALVVAGVLALGRRSRLARGVVLGAAVAQVAIAGYWAARLPALFSDLPSGAPGSAVSVVTMVFAAAPLVTLGLVLFPPGRTWFDGTPRP